ncbi:succinic semialdehyde dehydrogenase [Isoptericola sp. b441]|uniref:Succinic semialdehyde dehydrogenase n=1 Tax=Actinotalea lenta TaxID=3064654 RepID=A0ABT9D601_9CELL|nr:MULTISPECIES: succinic semialdehyde dehydrogenase [unclassified Isoptericola]MDO8106247.1 succinic semialdehyde dehydrogenase [Isoptericola sp. b441]MDO8122033.1 succinic semialdehyde dehydrogenase [Isoptericola sp. b490]
MSDVAQQQERRAGGADDPLDTVRLASLVATARTPERAVVSPVDGTVVGEVPVCTPEDVVAAGTRAVSAQRAWAARPVRERAAVVRRFAALVLDEQTWLMDLATAESGKTRRDAFEEVADIALAARWFAGAAPRVLRRRRVAGAFPVATRTTVHRRPKGLVGVISPWNYPLTLAVSDAIPALLAGNGIVLKPDSQTPFCALALLDLLRRAGLPADLMQVVTGPGAELGGAIVDTVDALMFTGSTATGRVLAEQCGRRLISFSGELGGKNAMLVLPGAELERAVEGAVRACFANTGQLCVSMERLYVADAIYDTFVPAFVERVAALRHGTGWDGEVGTLTTAGQLDRVAEHVREAVAKGATVLTGGVPRPGHGELGYAPTVLTGVTDDMALAREETFGPVVSVYRVGDTEEAVSRADDSPYGLNASIWGPAAVARRAASRLHVGTVNVNEGYTAAWASHAAPMGGTRDSGLGRRHGREGLLAWTEPQTVAEQRLVPAGYLPGVPPERYARWITAFARLLHRVPVR